MSTRINEKENLIVVQPFAANHIILKDLIKFLNEYFTVYFIDLPGFIKTIPPLSKISFESYSKFVQGKIEELDLKEYWIAGISLGFEVVNITKLDSKCKGIIAIEPYINSASLSSNFKRKVKYLIFLNNLVCYLKLYNLVWNSRLFRKNFHKFSELPKDVIDIIFEQVDPKTFFETTRLIFKNKKNASFHHLPYALLVNKCDGIISYDYLIRTFKKNPEKELVLDDIKISHCPSDLSKEYFEKSFPQKDRQKLLDFIINQEN